MSDEQKDKQDKTEEPSSKKLDDARKKGEVVLGRDATATAGLASTIGALIGVAEPLQASLVHVTRGSMDDLVSGNFSFFTRAAPAMVLGLLPVLAAGIGVGFATLLQTQAGFWPERALPDFKKVFSKERVLKPFKLETLIDILLAFVKLVALAIALRVALGDAFLTLPRTIAAPVEGILQRLLTPIAQASSAVLVVMTGLAILDYAVTRRRFIEKMKMTKDEIKKEMKEELGDPHIKGARKRRHRELAEARVGDVPLADALVVNPTHFAVAIRYRKDEASAPRIIAKGKDAIAAYMRELAHEHRIPIYRDVPLARLLYKNVKVGQAVPAETFQAVATVLAWVFKMTGRVPGTGPAWPKSPADRPKPNRRRQRTANPSISNAPKSKIRKHA